MRISLRFLLPGAIMGLLVIVGTLLVSGFIYSNYQREMKNIVNERIADLKVIQSTLYDPILYYRAYTMYPELRLLFVKRTAQAPNVVFLRVVHPTGKILISNLEEEVGETIGDIPPFLQEVSVRQRKWKGGPILEISMRGVATENLWMGIDLKPIQQAAFRLAILMGLGIFGAVIFIGLILYFLLHRILLNPIMALYTGMEKVKKGNLDIKIDVKSKTEIGELVDTFNEMIKDLRKSHVALEETKAVLEIKVQARTKELEDLTQNLEKKVKERTEDLENKTNDLENSQKALMNILEDVEKSRKALINILEDIEEARGKAEEEREKTLIIINNFTDGLLVFDKENKLLLVNPQAENFLKIKTNQIKGKSTSELSEYPNLKSLIDLLGKEIRSIFRKELLIEENLTLEISTVSMSGDREGFGTLVILHDISREKMIERIKTEFVSLAAHQLRTPLSAIKWTLKMILDGDLGKITKEQREFIEKSYQSNERMIVLVNELLDVTRIEEGRYLYRPVLADFENMVHFVLNSYQEEIARKKIVLDFKKPETKLPRIAMDVEKMRLVIQNLLDNAVKYSFSGGKIVILLKYDKDKKEIMFVIKDSGAGIPQDQQTRVFTKFFRGANVIRIETEGTGLGLFISKNIIEAHGGKIWFESEERKGATFYFTMPI